MSNSEKKEPQIRFRNYTITWKQCKLGEVVQTLPFKTYIKIPEKNGKYEVIQQGNKPIIGYANGNPCYDYKESVIFGDHTLSLYKPSCPFFVATDGVRIVQGKNNLDGFYLLTLLEKYKPRSEGYKRYFSILIDSDCFITENQNEQKKLGLFYDRLDNLIVLHQRKLNIIKDMKKSFLQKMFPKVDEKNPVILFYKFTDDWEQRKVGDYYDFKNGLNKSKEFFGSGTPIVNFTDVFHNRGIYLENLKGRVTLDMSEIKNYEVKQGDLFFTRTSETIDEIGYPSVMLGMPENTVFSGFVLRGRTILKEDPLDNLFKKYVFFTDVFRKEMIKKSSMTTRALTSGTAIKNMVFFHPVQVEEQRKIGEYFTNLDNLITLHQQKLQKLQDMKKTMLKKMFI